MRRWLVLALVLILPLRAGAEDDLRALVVSGDRAGVEAMLRAAVVAGAAADAEPDAERAMFDLFTDTQPEIAAFTTDWLAAAPDNALALTARGWHLYARGWNARGRATADAVYPHAMAVLRADHAQALALAEAALAVEPGLIAASDLKLMLTTTLGNPEVIPGTLEQVMALHPNRGSLMRAMGALAPQWGGSPAQVRLLCDRYAPQVRSVPGYDMQVCAIDAVYWGNFWNGDQRDEAHQLLQLTPNPILDYARLQDALTYLGPPQQRATLLERIKAKRDLTRNEAMALDVALAEIAGGLNSQVEWKIAVANALDWNRNAADHDPFDPQIVTAYVATALEAEQNLGTASDVPDLIRRLQRLLAQVPWSADAWVLLGDLTGRTDTPGQVDLDRIARVEPYYINAVVYSNYAHSAVKSLIWTKFWAIIDVRNLVNDVDVSGLTPAERARYDEVVYCPLIRQMTILGYVCRNQGISDDQCSGFHVDPARVMNRLRAVVAEGSCPAEVERLPETLAYSPIEITFPPAP
jgi:hypothetical protein